MAATDGTLWRGCVWVLAAVVAAATSCAYDPQLGAGTKFTCTATSDCPAGQICVAHPVAIARKVCCRTPTCDEPLAKDGGGSAQEAAVDAPHSADGPSVTVRPDEPEVGPPAVPPAPADARAGADASGGEPVPRCGNGTMDPCLNGDGCCPSTCTRANDNDCQRPAGERCVEAVECASGNCVDGFCCTEVNCPACQACTSAGGRCAMLPANSEDNVPSGTCAGDRACDGQGACKLKSGQACGREDARCGSGHCRDGVCCDSACSGPCQACAMSGMVGTCTALRGAQDADSCGGGLSCDESGICAGLSLSLPSHDFGALMSGQVSPAVSFTVTNPVGAAGTGKLAATLAGPNGTQFRISADHCSGVTLTPAETCVIDVVFAPAAAGNMQGNLSVSASPGGAVAASLLGVGRAPPPVANLAVSPPVAEFGNLSVGSPAVIRTVSLTNSGGASTGSIAVALTPALGPFEILLNGCVNPLAPGARCTVDVRFLPTAAGPATASISATATPGGRVMATLMGNGLGPGITISPPNHLCGTLLTGPFGAEFGSGQEFQVLNSGVAATEPLVVALKGPDAPFFILGDNCSGMRLAPGQTCSTSVEFHPGFLDGATFHPATPGDKTATLSVSAGAGISETATCTGFAVQASPVRITPTSFTIQNAHQDATFAMQNLGMTASGLLRREITGPDAALFEIDTSCYMVGPQEACPVVIKYTGGPGRRQATFTVSGFTGTVTASLFADF